MKKRLLLIILTFALMIGLISCGDGDVVETISDRHVFDSATITID